MNIYVVNVNFGSVTRNLVRRVNSSRILYFAYRKLLKIILFASLNSCNFVGNAGCFWLGCTFSNCDGKVPQCGGCSPSSLSNDLISFQSDFFTHMFSFPGGINVPYLKRSGQMNTYVLVYLVFWKHYTFPMHILFFRLEIKLLCSTLMFHYVFFCILPPHNNSECNRKCQYLTTISLCFYLTTISLYCLSFKLRDRFEQWKRLIHLFRRNDSFPKSYLVVLMRLVSSAFIGINGS